MNKMVLIADEHCVSMEGMTFILKSMSQDIVIDRAYNKEELMNLVEKKDYILLILDIALLGDVYDSPVKKIKESSSNLKIMIFTACKEDVMLRYLYEGAEAFVYKSDEESKIRTALASIFTCGYYYQQELLYDFIHKNQLKSSSRVGLEILSEREKQVYCYLLIGRGLLEIANDLGLHPSTVSIYKKRLFKKLNVHSLVDLIEYNNGEKVFLPYCKG
ncbi:DNA-binding response regulator [Chryseobacterium nematophagum]|uniref:DNA-binding response regulator n=1 Tax=Chryseobacterium nematophagum TaxID=2305228 RepID=A0A3M7TJM6_9FLAO|nr:response regulator transcription factor [Chryseobacterium nematophagum]RNA62859.1 DNA-binding response regulator [Chryseobacterium nematophagum]